MKKYNLTNLLILLIGIFTFVSCSFDENSNNYGSVKHCGQTYKTVVIRKQTWFAENVNCPTDDRNKEL